MTVNDVINLVTCFRYNLQTRSKIRNRYPIPGSIATILISNFVRYNRVTKKLHTWHYQGSQVTWIQFTDPIENEDQILHLKFYMYYWLKVCQICWGEIRFEFMTSSWGSHDLSTIYRPDRKLGPDLVSQVLRALLTWNFQSHDNKGNRKIMLRINTRWFNVILDEGFSFQIQQKTATNFIFVYGLNINFQLLIM